MAGNDIGGPAVNYDAEADVLYVSLEAGRRGVGWEPEEGIVIRLDPDTSEVVGFTILDYQTDFLARGRSLAEVDVLARLGVPEDILEAVPA